MMYRLAVVVLVAIVLAFGVLLSRAHDNPESWIGAGGYKNRIGELCCGKNDCTPIEGTVRVTPTGYVLPNGDVIPFGKAAPSEDKDYWECIWGGERKCFFAPIGGV